MSSSAHETINKALADAVRLLPSQGPIGVFVHHNIWEAFEHLPFEKAAIKASQTFRGEPYMPESWYREKFKEGRIDKTDLEAILSRDFSEDAHGDDLLLGGRFSRRELRRALLHRGLIEPDDDSITWQLEEFGLLRWFLPDLDPVANRAVIAETSSWLSVQLHTHDDPALLFRDHFYRMDPKELVRRWLGAEPTAHGIASALRSQPQACTVASLWAACTYRVASCVAPRKNDAKKNHVRIRDLLFDITRRDLDDMVHEVLVPILASFLDQGLAYWPMPDAALGLLAAMQHVILKGPHAVAPLWHELRKILRENNHAELGAEASIVVSLQAMGYPQESWPMVIQETALALPGWGGMIGRLQREPELAPDHCPPCKFSEFMAVRLLFDHAAALVLAHKEFDHVGTAAALWTTPDASVLRVIPDPRRVEAFSLFQVAQDLGISTPNLLDLSDQEIREVTDEIRVFDHVERRRIWHLAFECHYRRGILQAIGTYRKTVTPSLEHLPPPRLQLVFCIDAREESLRRYLEEISHDIETHGTGGFFGVAVAYRGLDDGYHAPLCPVVQKPEHEVREFSMEGDDSTKQRRYLARRRVIATLLLNFFVGSRGLLRGWLATCGLGLLAIVPMSVRILHPHLVSRLNRWFQKSFFPKPQTQLALQRDAEERGSLALFPGFTSEEMANRVERVLQDIGLTRRFARIISMIGHGSSSLNNPFESAYECAACAGRKGGPNARLFALMANKQKVREILAQRGITIPGSTVFVAGYHDTCNDSISWFDLENVPASHHEDLAYLKSSFDRARMQNAHERCRRFENVPLDYSDEQTLIAAEGRAEDLAQPRAEYGNASNAMCVFGRRSLTRGLFLDRRAFLVSYDPTIDHDAEIISRLLAAMGPVGMNINLEYGLSYIDNERYGAGSKLPHNVTSLIGVMNGPMSDLRTGFPWQMVEIHEPMRLLVIIEGTPATIARVAERQPAVGRAISNRWVQLALIDPDTGVVSEYTHGSFGTVSGGKPLPSIARSQDWYFGHRENLGVSIVRSAIARPERSAGVSP